MNIRNRIGGSVCVFIGFLAGMFELSKIPFFEIRCLLIFAVLGIILAVFAALWWDLMAPQKWS